MQNLNRCTKALLAVFIGLLYVSLARAALWDDITHIYPLNYTNQSDIAGLKNLTYINSTPFTSPGKSPDGSYNKLFRTGDKYYHPSFNEDAQNFTMSFWLNITTMPYLASYVVQTGGGATEINVYQNSSGRSYLKFSLNCGTLYVNYTSNIYNFITWTVNSTGSQVWINGTMVDNISSTSCSQSMNGVMYLGDGSGNPSNFTIDEVYMWNRSITSAEISQLYNASAGLFYPSIPTDSTYNSLTLNSPLDDTYSNFAATDFKFTPSLNNTISGCSLYFNQTVDLWTFLEANTSPILNNSMNTISYTISDRHFKWNIKCNTTDGQYVWGANNFTVKIDSTMPKLTIYSPQNNSYFTNSFYVDSVCTDSSIYILNYTFYNATSLLNSSQVNTSNGTSLSLNVTYNINQYKTGIYTLNISCSDGHTASKFDPITKIKTSPSKIDYKFDGDDIGVEVVSEEKIKRLYTSKLSDRYIINIDFEQEVETFRYKITAGKFIRYTSEFKGHIIIDDKYWFDTEPYDAEIVETGEGYVILEVAAKGKDKIQTESIGGLNINVTTYTLKFGYYKDVSYDASTIPNQINNMYVDLGNRTGISGTINLIYNNSLYSPISSSYNSTIGYTRFTFMPIAPSVSESKNISFYFNYTYQDGVTGTSGQFNQTVIKLDMQLCYGNNVSTLNLHFKDESGLYSINVSGEANIELLGVSSTNTSFSPINWTDRNNISICISPANTTVNVDAYIKYTGNGDLTHRYYIINRTLTANVTNLYLYNFNSSSGLSDMLGTVRYSSSYNVFPDVYVSLKRYYAGENLWRIVQMDKSDAFGQIFFNVIEESEDYDIVFEYGNAQIYDTGNIKFVCSSGSCSLTFTMNPSESASEVINMHPTYSYNNNTGIITITWDDSTDSIDNVTIDVILISPAMESVCYMNSNNYSGQFRCNISGHYGTFFVTAKEYGSLDTWLSEQIIVQAITSLIKLPAFAKYSSDMTFWSGGLIATFTLAGAIVSPFMAIIFAILGLVVVSYLQINTMITLAFVIPAIIIGIIISTLMRSS